MNIASPSELVKTIGFAHTAATTAKVPLLISGKVFIPLNTRKANEHNAFVYESEIDAMKSTAAQAWVPGQPIYLVVATSTLTTADTGNTLFGHALQPKAAAATASPLVAFNSFAQA